MKVEVKFEYRESSNHVYKTVKYTLNGKEVTARNKHIRELLSGDDTPRILRQNTFFWKPAPYSSWRRRREEEVKQLVVSWLEKKGFKVEVNPYYECLVIGVKEVDEEVKKGR